MRNDFSFATNTLQVKLTNPESMPIRAHPTDAGADLRATTSYSIYPNEQKTIGTGVAVKIPEGYVGLVFSRSSMGKVAVTLANSVGVIDADYRGEIKVMIKNYGEDIFRVEVGDRIAQLVICPIVTPEFVAFTGEDEAWSKTSRGLGGFGSSGKS
jgi:dUTP pyrophosphatase